MGLVQAVVQAARDEVPVPAGEPQHARFLRDWLRLATRGELLEDIWQDASDAASESLDVIISRLRRKLGDGGEMAIHTIRGEGYRFEIRP